MKHLVTHNPADPMPALALKAYKVVLVVDVVESVRLMAGHEAEVVARWCAFMDDAARRVLPQHRGRLVKSLGDGLLADFDQPVDAVKTAIEFHTFFMPANRQLPTNQQIHMRAGIHASHLFLGEHDVYGHGVNLAARVATLGQAGEIVVTAPVRDGIVDGVDADLEDMGKSYLKHWPEPVRTWRVHAASEGYANWRPQRRERVASVFRPSIAIIAFATRAPSPEHLAIGELIADGVTAQLTHCKDIRVIARLSSTELRGRRSTFIETDARFGATYVLSGSYAVVGQEVLITAELADTRCGEVLWAERMNGDTMDLLQVHSELINHLSTACAQALLNADAQRRMVLPKPDVNAMLLGSITHMHPPTQRGL